jgi:hypothetical protein
MKKRDKSLQLHRDTIRHLDGRALGLNDLPKVAGAGPHTSESKPCCGSDPVLLQADAIGTTCGGEF